MSERKQIVIHVGFPKCASSWMQARLFTPTNGFDVPWPSMENKIVEQVCHVRATRFNPDSVREEYMKDWDELGSANTTSVISFETLVGDPIQKLYWRDEIARRLASCFGDAKVIVCVRNQVDFALATWREYVRRGGYLKLDEYLPLLRADPAGYRSYCSREYLYFCDAVACYRGLFGAENVLCLPMEELVENPNSFTDAICEFLGVAVKRDLDYAPIYAGYGMLTTEVLRLLNHLSPMTSRERKPSRIAKAISWLARFIQRRVPRTLQESRKRVYKQRIQSAFSGAYAESNRELQRYTDDDLARLGYDL